MPEKQQNLYLQLDQADVERVMIDDAKTAAEHEAIILKYHQTGILDRDDAIKKYNEFNTNHPEYYINMTVIASASGSAVSIDRVSDNVVIGNLQAQLDYLIGKKITEDKFETNRYLPTEKRA